MPTSHRELQEALTRADTAMRADDIEAATAAMAEGAEVCRQLREAGLPFPADEAERLRQLADDCGNALVELSNRLNARSFRGDKHRRGILSYQQRPRR